MEVIKNSRGNQSGCEPLNSENEYEKNVQVSRPTSLHLAIT